MNRSANEVMRDVIAAAVIDGIGALKAASKGLPNTLLRDIGAIHANTAVADLPPELTRSIDDSVRGALSKLLREGYAVAPSRPEAPRPRPAQGTIIPRRGDNAPRTPRNDGPPRGPRPPRAGGPGKPPRR
ncbi:hypothetical protein SPAN111604_02940 [Sphingomonas antarctica]|uniref:hypothetical protein n=1 Tax=Sphingomonas antarctica TaxID=2040274 RepID=UPI0039ECDFA6